MKSVAIEKIKKYNENYLKNEKNKIMQNVLFENEITQSVRVHDQVKYDQHKFTIDIPTMRCTNQKSSGRCWIFAALNVLRELVAKKCGIDDFELSQNYVAFFDKFEKINFLLEAILELKDVNYDDRTLSHLLSIGVQDGGQWDMFVSIIKKYGLAPKMAMEETFQSSNTRSMNYVINVTIRKFAAFVQKNAKDEKLIEEEKEKVLAKLYEFLCIGFGRPVEKFDFEYVDKEKKYHLDEDLTPKSFMEKYVGNILDDYVSVINAPTLDKPFNEMYTVKYLGNVIGGNEIRYLNLPIEEFKELCLKQLKDNEVVWFGSDCGKFGDRIEGVWDDKAFDYKTAFDLDLDVNKGDMLDYHISAMNHAMVITGVAFKGENVTKWKIENSWGTDRANAGYYLMSDSWFDRFVFQAVINKKYLSKEQLNLLKKDPIKLEPWDPMGTLAD